MTRIGQPVERRRTQTPSLLLRRSVRLLHMSSRDFSALIRDLMCGNPFLVPFGPEGEGCGDGDLQVAHPRAIDSPTSVGQDRISSAGDDPCHMLCRDPASFSGPVRSPQAHFVQRRLQCSIPLAIGVSGGAGYSDSRYSDASIEAARGKEHRTAGDDRVPPDARSTPSIVPDLLVSRDRGVWRVSLNPEVVPRVRLNQALVERMRVAQGPQRAEIAEYLDEARWTLHNIGQRFSTILDVGEAIARRQRGFLELGSMAMQPLGLKQIANEIGIHESTVSRATSNKFLATPSGIYELRRFFSRAIVTVDGGACCATAIRELIRDFVEAEAPDCPLSDTEIARLLKEQGIVLARRTVTKYRQMLLIESSDRRRERVG